MKGYEMKEISKTVEVKSSIGSFSRLERRFENGVFDRAKLNMNTMSNVACEEVDISILTFEQAEELYKQLESVLATFEARDK